MSLFRCVYSLGVDCRTEKCVRELELKRFSSLFGNINTRNINNVIFHIQNNFDILLDSRYHVYINSNQNTINNNFEDLLKEYGPRTMHSKFDKLNNFHSATFAHHDLSIPSTKEHFNRAKNRFNLINSRNIPTLFVSIACRHLNNSLEDCLKLGELMRDLNKNAFTLILNLVEAFSTEEIIPCFKNKNCAVYTDVNDGNVNKCKTYFKSLIQQYDIGNLLNKDDII